MLAAQPFLGSGLDGHVGDHRSREILPFRPWLGVIPSDAPAVPPAVPWLSMTYIFGILIIYGRLRILSCPLRGYYSPQELAITGITIPAFLMVVLLFVLAGKRGRRNTAVFAALWTIIFLFPALMPDQRGGALLAERFLCLLSVGFCLLGGTLAETWLRNRRLLAGGLGVLVALPAAGSVWQGRVWKNEIVLFGEFTSVSPGSRLGYYNLGSALADQSRHHEAIAEFQHAVRIDPGHFQSFYNMGSSLWDLGRNREATSSYHTAIRIEPNLEPAWLNLGLVYRDEGVLERSIQTYKDGLHLFPDGLQMNAGLVLSCLKMGDIWAAKEHRRLLERNNPDLAGLIVTIISRYPGEKGEPGTP